MRRLPRCVGRRAFIGWQAMLASLRGGVATFYNWRKKYAGLMPSEMKRLRQLEDENNRLKKTPSHGLLANHCGQWLRIYLWIGNASGRTVKKALKPASQRCKHRLSASGIVSARLLMRFVRFGRSQLAKLVLLCVSNVRSIRTNPNVAIHWLTGFRKANAERQAALKCGLKRSVRRVYGSDIDAYMCCYGAKAGS